MVVRKSASPIFADVQGFFFQEIHLTQWQLSGSAVYIKFWKYLPIAANICTAISSMQVTLPEIIWYQALFQ